jgi:pimeloyl-ACP methyl ester carboxylesterase
LGYRLLLNDPDPALTSSWLEPCRKDSRICRDLAAFLQHVATTDLTEVSTRLKNFAKPVRLVWGMRDRFFTPSLGKRLAELFPNSTMTGVPDAKTFVPLDDPSAVIDAITTVSAQNVS